MLIYILCYNDETELDAQKQFMNYKWAKIERFTTSFMFENSFILNADTFAERDNWKDHAYVGFFSWSIFAKCSLLNDNIENILTEVESNGEYDAVAFSCVSLRSQKYGDPHCQHTPNYQEVWNETLVKNVDERLALDFTTFVSNNWCARPHLIKEYIDWVKNNVLIQLLRDPRIMMDALYSKDPTKELLDIGFSFYPLFPFIMERLSGAYFQLINKSAVNFLYCHPHILYKKHQLIK